MRGAKFLIRAATVAAVLAAWSGEASAGFFAGPYARVTKGVHNAGSGTLFSFGGEVGGTFLAFGARYGHKDGVEWFFPDIRGFYDFGLPFNLIVTPLIEFSPVIAFNGAKTLELVLRPGVRVGWAPLKILSVFVEPVVWDISIWRKTWVGGSSSSSSSVGQSYNFGFGAQFRF